MEFPDGLEVAVRARVNHERARAFPHPVLHAVDADDLLVGYSIESVDGDVIQVEANHAILSTLTSPQPRSFATRSRVLSSEQSIESLLVAHAMDYVMGNPNDWAPTGTSAGALQRLRDTLKELPEHTSTVDIDGESYDAAVVDFDDSRAMRLILRGAFVTVVAPKEVVRRGFVTGFPER